GPALLHVFGCDQVQAQARPAEARGAVARRGVRVVELADPADRLHLDGPPRELAGDIGVAVLAQAPVEVPVHVHPRRSAPGRLGEPGRIEARLGRGDARYRIGQPELALVQEVLLD